MKYFCPVCGSTIGLRTTYTGWDWESIDENTGEAYRTVEAERTDIHEMMYECDSCTWQADDSYFEGEEDDEND